MKKVLGQIFPLLALTFLTLVAVEAKSAPAGYSMYIGMIPGDDIVYLNGDVYLTPCFSRHGCEDSFTMVAKRQRCDLESFGLTKVPTIAGRLYCPRE